MYKMYEKWHWGHDEWYHDCFPDLPLRLSMFVYWNLFSAHNIDEILGK